MATNAETMIDNPPVGEKGRKPTHRRRAGKFFNLALSASLIGGSAAGLAWAINQAEKTSNPPPITSSENFPAPPTLDPYLEKSINKEPLSEVTTNIGYTIMVKSESTYKEGPLAYTLNFDHETIVAIEKNTTDNTIWLALSVPGKTLTREYSGINVKNFDGSTTPLYSYRGFTAWVQVDNNISILQEGKPEGNYGLDSLEKYLKIGNYISLIANVNDFGMAARQTDALMNKHSLDLLNKNVGKPNTDRGDQTFKFKADFALVTPNQ